MIDRYRIYYDLPTTELPEEKKSYQIKIVIDISIELKSIWRERQIVGLHFRNTVGVMIFSRYFSEICNVFGFWDCQEHFKSNIISDYIAYCIEIRTI